MREGHLILGNLSKAKMRTVPIRFTIAVAAFMLAALSSSADATSYAQVIRERDSVLSQILADRESRRASGTADEDAIAAAQLALYSFRRDVATATGEKIKNQELIVRLHEKKQEIVKARFSTGIVGKIEVLEATDSLLEAKQVLEELHLKAPKG
jgi:hypothetical protein